MKKSIVFRSLAVLSAAAFTTFVSATLDIEVTSVSVSGTQITVGLHNPSAVSESAGVRVTVAESGGGTETLESATVTIAAGATQTVTITASHTIVGVSDDPEPFVGN